MDPSYSSAEKFFTGNGGEFANNNFIQLCKSFGITVKTTAAKSPWSNGLVEHHNLILSDMFDKILHKNNCDFDLALAWAISAKNSLSNIPRFSPYQLSIGTNPKLPSLNLSKVPPITSTPTNKTIMKNLEALHRAREAFIASENSEKLRRALSHIRNQVIQSTSNLLQKIQQQPMSWYSKNTWTRRTTNLSQNGRSYHHTHPCKLQLINNPPQPNNLSQSNKNNNTYLFNNQSISAKNEQKSYNTDSELSD